MRVIPPEVYLANLQKRAWATCDRQPPDWRQDAVNRCTSYLTARYPGEPEKQSSILGMFLGQYDDAASRVPTKYQDPGWYDIVTLLADQLEATATGGGETTFKRPMFGSMPTGSVNALSVRVPGTEDNLVIFDEGLFAFAHELSKCLVRTFSVEKGEAGYEFDMNPGRIFFRVSQEPDLRLPFYRLLRAYVANDDPRLVEHYFIEPEYEALAICLRDAMETFALAHEYAHILAGHLDAARVAPSSMPKDEAVNTVWNREYEADILGASLAIPTVQRVKQVDYSLAYWGADLHFAAADLMGRAISTLATGNQDSFRLRSHPPALKRRAVLQTWLVQKLGDSGLTADRVLQPSEAILAAMWAIWEFQEPTFRALHQEGMRPATRWLRAVENQN